MNKNNKKRKPARAGKNSTPGSGEKHPQPAASRAGIESIVSSFNKGDFEAAEKNARRFSNQFPKHFFGWKALGTVLTQQKRYDDALAALKKAKALKPGDPEIFNSISTVFQDRGDSKEALTHADRALELKPDYPEAHNTKGRALQSMGRNDEALASYDKALGLNPGLSQAHYNKGALLRRLNRLEEALAACNKALELKPGHVEALNSRAIILRQLDRPEEALAACDRVLELKPDHPEAHNTRGNILQGLERHPEALRCYQAALNIKPGFAEAHNNKGNSLRLLGSYEKALASYERALAIHPDWAELHNSKGNALYHLDRLDEAIESYHRALQLRPDYANAYEGLMELYEKSNQTGELGRTLELARNHLPENHACIAHGEALLAINKGNHEKAIEHIGKINPEEISAAKRTDLTYLRAKLLDRMGRHHEAFSFFAEANSLASGSPEVRLAENKAGKSFEDFLLENFTESLVAGFSSLQDDTDDDTNVIFLVGFPRSGTTLLDTILLSHPEIEVVEEKPAVNQVIKTLAEMPGSFLKNLAEIDATQRLQLRDAYFRELNKHLKTGRNLVIDKHPLNTSKAGIIQRVFPNARFIFAQRHPCDCVLSCFMQNFKLKGEMVNFLDLNEAQRHYDKVMKLWFRYCDLLKLRAHTVVYENLVADFDNTLNPLLEFLNLDWDPALLDYRETALKRGKIGTASYNQVTQPLYTHAKGRWENYREQMAPVLPTLLPWAERMGYPA